MRCGKLLPFSFDFLSSTLLTFSLRNKPLKIKMNKERKTATGRVESFLKNAALKKKIKTPGHNFPVHSIKS